MNVPNTDLMACSGIYSDDKGFDFSITVEESKLKLKYGEQSDIEFIPCEPFKFYSKYINTELEFILSSVHEVVGMKIIQNGKSIETKKHT